MNETRTVRTCHKIMRFLVEKGMTKQVHRDIVKTAIVYVKGTDKRTLDNWFRALETLGFLERSAPLVYNMNLALCPDLLTHVLRTEKQKRLM